ncbi:autotransporter assembly complex protein TamB [Alginatibacterium sediminis]|nr:translocation/assembly module TamB domain-containing protein [Alginatibacterium sediminis]
MIKKVLLRSLKWLIRLIVFGVLVSLLIVTMIVGTERGLRFVADLVSDNVSGLVIENVRGQLWQGVSIEKLQWIQDGLELDLENTYAQIDWAGIDRKLLHVESLRSDNVIVSVDTIKLAESSSKQPQSDVATDSNELWTPPWPLLISEFKLEAFVLSVDGIGVELDALDFAGQWKADKIDVDKLIVQRWKVDLGQDEVAIDEQASVNGSEVAQINGVATQTKDVQQPELIETEDVDFRETQIVLPTITTPYALNILELRLTNGEIIAGNERFELEQIHLQGQWFESQLSLADLSIEAAYKQDAVSLELNGEQSLSGNYLTNLKLATKLNYQGIKQSLDLSLNGPQDQTQLALDSAGLAQISLNGVLDWSDLKLKHNMSLDLSKVELSQLKQWFLMPESLSELKPKTVSLNSEGDLYELDFELKAVASWLEEILLEVEGKTSLEAISQFKLKLESVDNSLQTPRETAQRLELSGNVAWKDAIALAVQGNFDHIDLKPWLAPFASLPDEPLPILDGALDVSLIGDNWKANNIEVNGDWLALPIKLKTTGEGTLAGIINSLDLKLQLADNHIVAKGALSPQKMDLKGSIDAKQLEQLPWVDKGQVSGDFAVSGNYQQPDIEWDLSALGLSAYQVTIDKFTSQASLKLDQAFSGSINTNINNIKVAGEQIKSAELAYQSKAKQQSLSLDLKQSKRSVSAKLNGSGDASNWKGQLESASLDAELGLWQLEQAMALQLENGVPNIGAHCWVQKRSKLCLDQSLSIAESLDVKASLRNFDFEILQALIDQDLEFDATADATVVATIAGSKVTSAELKFLMPKGQVSLSNEFDEKQTFTYDQLDLVAKVKNDQLRADLEFETAEVGELKAWIETPIVAKTKTLRGELEILPIQLQKFAPLAPELSRLEGLLEAKIAIAGSLLKPKLNGLVELKDTFVAGDQLPLDIDNLSTQIKFSEQKANIEGGFTSSNQPAKWLGEIDWSTGKPLGSVTFDADKLELLIPPMVSLVVSPDISVGFGERVLDIRGEVLVNSGKIQVKNVPQSALQSSSDVIVIEEEIEGQSTSQLTALDITVNLGDDLSLLALGLDTQLTGSINVTQPPGKAMVASGQIDLEDGTFAAYGQSLVIEKGQLTFSGPLEEPYLDVRAIRNPNMIEDNVTAGIKVLGSASDAKTELFSEPSMSQNEMLSYLLRGRGLDSGSDDNAFASMLITAGLNQGSGVVGKVGDTLGLQDMSVGAAGAGNDTQVEVSAYVLPGVQVKYGMGVFEPINELTIRYEVMPRLFIEAFSGLDSALDVYYEFTTD